MLARVEEKRRALLQKQRDLEETLREFEDVREAIDERYRALGLNPPTRSSSVAAE